MQVGLESLAMMLGEELQVVVAVAVGQLFVHCSVHMVGGLPAAEVELLLLLSNV